MVYSPAFIFSSGYLLGFFLCAGLRLGALRWFQAFLASSPCTACASSYHFASITPPPWRSAFSQFAPVVKLGLPVLASGSNCAVKPTRLRRAAYVRLLVPRKNRFSQAHVYPNGISPLRRRSVLRLPFLRASPVFSAPVSFFKRCAASVAQRFFTVRARRQIRVTCFGFWF